MLKQYFQYITNLRKIRNIITVRSLLLISSMYIQPMLQGGNALAVLALAAIFVGLIGTYAANGYEIRTNMESDKPTTLGSYLKFFFLMLVFSAVVVLIIDFAVSPFVGPQLKPYLESYVKDPKTPLPPELERLYILLPFAIGLVLFTLVPVLIAKISVVQGILTFGKYLRRTDYIQVAWTSYLVFFVPFFVLYILSSFPNFLSSFFGLLLVLIVIFLSLTWDLILHFPVFYIVKKIDASTDTNPLSDGPIESG
ncbi:putative membrane protein [Leptospira fainei serovar Hurstbridge str. BUT 6]|uniref:Membrane protein n=2 Tax=Leptospira fainei TaxID=48782 RepID=S3VF15_9LEPT|nr:putative membrane protein [Leptospira fainei serovar Hurstbridge str. BUT 6]